jgi:hypothetical protein
VDCEERDEEEVVQGDRVAEHVDQTAGSREAEEDELVPEDPQLGLLVVVVFDLLRVVDQYHELGDHLTVQREDGVDVREAEGVVLDAFAVEAASDLSFIGCLHRFHHLCRRTKMAWRRTSSRCCRTPRAS